MNRTLLILIVLLLKVSLVFSDKILIPMDFSQPDHLKSYGVAYRCLHNLGLKVEWLLNYRGGSFLTENIQDVINITKEGGVKYEIISYAEVEKIYQVIEQNNMEKIMLEKAPKIAVYAPPDIEPWDDAVTLVLTYANIPFDIIWDEEILSDILKNIDWLHLHHEDFTGQFGKFYLGFSQADWYRRQVRLNEGVARKLGFSTVQQTKLAVGKKIKEFVEEGKLLFAMCSAPDSLDVALAVDGVDIVPAEIDGTGIDLGIREKIDYQRTFAFENFEIVMGLHSREISNINIPVEPYEIRGDYFSLFEFSAKQDPIPTMLTQSHTKVIQDFLGQTTAFNRNTIKESVVVMGDTEGTPRVKYIYGVKGKGAFVFYGGHDPEDFAHYVGEAPTELKYHKHSPGYRLILNNVLFPAAKRKKQKT